MRIVEVRNSQRDTPLGRCLYCERTDALTEEHVIPYGLAGKLILPAASCPSCSVLTAEFERRVLRGFMAAPRAVAGFPTRRPKERLPDVPITVRDGSGHSTHMLPLDQATALLPLPMFEIAGVMSGRPLGGDVLLIGHETIRFGVDPSTVAERLDTQEVVLHGSWDIVSYVRMLAKIAIGFASATLGPLPLTDVPLIDLVRTGNTAGVSHWLGSVNVEVAPQLQGATHTATLRASDHPTEPSRRLVSVRLKLFANSGAQGYEIVALNSDRSDAIFRRLPG